MDLNQELAAKLHAGLAERLLALLNTEACEHCGRSAASAQELNQIRAFLNDNGVTAVAAPKTPLHRITEKMPFVDPDEQRVLKQA